MCRMFCRIEAREGSGITNSFALKVNMEFERVTFFTGRQFIHDAIMSISCNRSVANSFASFRRVSKLLNTLMLLSTKLENCSFPCLGLTTQEGKGLFIEMLLNDAWASVIISSGWEYFTKRIESAEINDLLLRSLHWKQKKNPVTQSRPNTRAKLTQSLDLVLLCHTRMFILSSEILEKKVEVASNFFIFTEIQGSVRI